MKFKKLVLFTAAVAVSVAAAFGAACGGTDKGEVQQLNYSESTERISNPDQGFYRPVYVKVTEDGVVYNKNIVTAETQLYHLRIDISAFSKAVNGIADKPVTQAALDGLGGVLSFLRENDKNAVVRFAYAPGYGGGKDKEPSLQMILKHVGQACGVLNEYGDVITAIETGLIGPWGEMHSSALANPESISKIADKLLMQTESIPVLLRTPKMIYDYLGITINDIAGYKIADTEKAYRLGLYNDGYLGSESDLGTYTDREKEIEFLSGQTGHLPFGGEVVVPESKLHDIGVCIPEMCKIHLSYLNAEWNDKVIAKWKNSYYTEACGADEAYYGKTAFEYIENRMGYRFVLKKSVFALSDKLEISLTLANVGFGNMNKTKRAMLIFTDENGAVKYERDAGIFVGGPGFGCATETNFADGSYTVYLRLYGGEADGAKRYCVKFANGGLWNETLKANKIGELEIGN